jgi:hypothetical protein
MTTNVSPAVLQPGMQLGTVAAVAVLGAANSQTIVKRAVFTNTGTAAATITAYRVANGGSVAVTNEIIPGRSVAGGTTDLAPELSNMVLNAGDEIQCLSGTAAQVNFFASGFVAS